MKKIFVLLFILCTCSTFAGGLSGGGGIDPTAARDDLSNVTPATGRSNLDVYSKAEVSAAIATETAERDAHEASTTTSVHGLGTMAGKTASDYYTAAELATYSAATSADLTGSNIAAPNTFLTNLGAWYTGNPTTGADTASTTLAVNGAATSIAVASGACGFITADVTGQLDSTLSAVHVHLEAAYENHNNTLSIYGNPASITSQINAPTWAAWVDVGDGVAKICATGSVGTIWNCKKLEVK